MANPTKVSETLAKGTSPAAPKVNVVKDNVATQVHLDVSAVANKAIDVLKPAAPDPNADGGFSSTGPVWWVGLNNDQTHSLEGILTTGGGLLASLAGPLWPAVGAALVASVGYIEAINKLFGSNGVDVNGVIGTEGLIVTPRVGKVYSDLIQAARMVVSGRTIVDFLVIASGDIPALGATLGIPVVAAVLTAVEAGNPLGWALAGALGLAVNLLEAAPDPNTHGHIWANRDQPQQWETFILAQIATGNKVSLLSWQGLFSAQGGGGNDVYANRPQVGDWETWTLIDNNDGTVSFKSFNGNYLSAQQGGGDGNAVYVNRTTIGTWEKFFLVSLPDGRVALKTHDKGKFVSVQQ